MAKVMLNELPQYRERVLLNGLECRCQPESLLGMISRWVTSTPSINLCKPRGSSGQRILIYVLLSTWMGAHKSVLHETVVNSVAVRSSRFNTVQQLVENHGLKTNGLQRGFQGREPGPEPDSAIY